MPIKWTDAEIAAAKQTVKDFLIKKDTYFGHDGVSSMVRDNVEYLLTNGCVFSVTAEPNKVTITGEFDISLTFSSFHNVVFSMFVKDGDYIVDSRILNNDWSEGDIAANAKLDVLLFRFAHLFKCLYDMKGAMVMIEEAYPVNE